MRRTRIMTITRSSLLYWPRETRTCCGNTNILFHVKNLVWCVEAQDTLSASRLNVGNSDADVHQRNMERSTAPQRSSTFPILIPVEPWCRLIFLDLYTASTVVIWIQLFDNIKYLVYRNIRSVLSNVAWISVLRLPPPDGITALYDFKLRIFKHTSEQQKQAMASLCSRLPSFHLVLISRFVLAKWIFQNIRHQIRPCRIEVENVKRGRRRRGHHRFHNTQNSQMD